MYEVPGLSSPGFIVRHRRSFLYRSDSKADEQAGAALYRDKGCPQCHGADLNGNKKGPALADIRNDPAWPPEKITKQITDGGPKMPPFGESLTDPEVAQLVAFLRAKDRPAPPPPQPAVELIG